MTPRVLLVALSLSACQADAPPPVNAGDSLDCAAGPAPEGSPADALQWMIGTWESAEDRTTERWCEAADGSLVGDNRTVDPAGREVHSERLRIVQRGDALVYIASPSTQATTEFTGRARCGPDTLGNCATTCEAVFENPAHDFPKTVTYGRCLQNEFLVATISGDDTQRRASWTFRRAD